MKGVTTLANSLRSLNCKPSRKDSERSFDDVSSIPDIPTEVWVNHVIPFLDRIHQDRLALTRKDIYETYIETTKVHGRPWPLGRFKIRRPVVSVAFSPTEQDLAMVASNTKHITIYNKDHGSSEPLNGHKGIVSDVTFSHSGVLASSSRTDGTVRLWSKEEKTDDKNERHDNDDKNNQKKEKGTSSRGYRCHRVLVIRVYDIRFVRFSPIGDLVATWGSDPLIRLTNIQDATMVASTDWRSILGVSCQACVAFSKARPQILAHAFNNQTVRIWNWTTQTSAELHDSDRARALDYASYITSIAFYDDPVLGHECLAVGCRVAKVKLWDLSVLSCIRTIHLGSKWSAVTHLVFSEDGTKMASTGGGSHIRIFSVADGECVTTLERHKNRVESLSFSSDASVLASGSCDRTLRLWDTLGS